MSIYTNDGLAGVVPLAEPLTGHRWDLLALGAQQVQYEQQPYTKGESMGVYHFGLDAQWIDRERRAEFALACYGLPQDWTRAPDQPVTQESRWRSFLRRALDS